MLILTTKKQKENEILEAKKIEAITDKRKKYDYDIKHYKMWRL